MATDKFEIALVGSEDMLRRLNAAVAMLDDPYELLDAIGAQLETNVNIRFDTKHDAGGHAWAPLAPATIALYEHKYGGSIPGSLLERSRHMRDSLTHNTTSESTEVGFSMFYAGWHVTGTRRMVRRDPLFATVNQEGTEGEMGDQDEQDILTIIEQHLNDALG